jgi:hypothetical protein
MPQATPAARVRPIVTASVVGSTLAPPIRGTPKVCRRERMAVVSAATGMPMMLPPTASSMLSVSVWAVRWPGRAPTAIRTENSCLRAFRRLRSRFERLTHAITRMQPTAPTRMRKGLRNFPRRAESSGLATAPSAPFLGYFCSFRRLAAERSSWAWASVTPGRRRPIPKSVLPHCCVSGARGKGTSIPTSVPGEKMEVKSKDSGSTPTTVAGWLLREIVRPTIPGSAWKWARQ